MFEQRREQMPFDMIDADNRDAGGLRETLGAHQAHQQRSDQPRTTGHRDTADIGESDSRRSANARSITGRIVIT